jgi:hypothetical protein
MTFAQRRNRLTTHFSERIPVVKQCISVWVLTFTHAVAPLGGRGGRTWKNSSLVIYTVEKKGTSRIWACKGKGKGKGKGKFLFAHHEGVRRSGDYLQSFWTEKLGWDEVPSFPPYRVPVPILFGGRYFIMEIICMLQLAHKVRCIFVNFYMWHPLCFVTISELRTPANSYSYWQTIFCIQCPSRFGPNGQSSIHFFFRVI